MPHKGTVTRVSKYGLQMDGQATWYNWANDYADHPHVEKGQVITIDINEKGYVTSLDLLTDSPAVEGTGGSAFRSPLHIVRQGALEMAVHLLAATPEDSTLPNILELAEAFENWILREEDPR